MLRPALTLLACLLLPVPSSAQERPVRTHVVAPGNTLWGLSRTYYGDPYGWKRILDANRDRIDDPDVLPPGIELRIPPLAASPDRRPATVSMMRISGPPAAPATESPNEPSAGVKPAISEGAFLRAPWLVPSGRQPEIFGVIEGLASADRPVHVLRPFDRVRIRVEGGALPPGSGLQAFRADPGPGDVGQVMKPTGTLTVVEILPEAVVAEVESVYSRMSAGDLVRPLPEIPSIPGGTGQPVSDGPSYVLIGFAEPNPVQTLGAYVFLDAGSGDGLRSGDLLEVVAEDASPGSDAGRGAAQVVVVHDNYATARITSLENPVFRRGVVLRLSRRMR